MELKNSIPNRRDWREMNYLSIGDGVKKFAVVTTTLGVLATLGGPAQAHTSAAKAWCVRSYSNATMYIDTPAKVPFVATGSSATQTVWFIAHYWYGYGTSVQYKGHGEWFYNRLNPGQVTTSNWFRNGTAQIGTWRSSHYINWYSSSYWYITYELVWQQNGKEVHRDHIRPGHYASDGSFANRTECYNPMA
jgi:hypothetical protein